MTSSILIKSPFQDIITRDVPPKHPSIYKLPPDVKNMWHFLNGEDLPKHVEVPIFSISFQNTPGDLVLFYTTENSFIGAGVFCAAQYNVHRLYVGFTDLFPHVTLLISNCKWIDDDDVRLLIDAQTATEWYFQKQLEDFEIKEEESSIQEEKRFTPLGITPADKLFFSELLNVLKTPGNTPSTF